MARDTQDTVREILGNFGSLGMARRLFSELNYDPTHDALGTSGWNQTATDALAEDPQVIACLGEFKVVYARLKSEDRLRLGDERAVVNRLLQQHPYLLCLFSNSQQELWHFVNAKYDEDVKRRRLFRRITVSPTERLRTAAERLSLLDLGTLGPSLVGL